MKNLVFGQQTRLNKRVMGLIILFLMTFLGVSSLATFLNHSSQLTATPTFDVTPKQQPLRVAVVPARNSQQQEQKLQSLAVYLQEILKRPIDIQITTNYETAVDLLVEEKVEMAYLGALTYIKAHDRNPNIKPLVLPIEQITGRPWYISAIVVNSKQDIDSLEDLRGKRFAFVSRSSTSGFLMPMNAFEKAGINPVRDFASIRYSGSHDQAEADLLAGKVDAIATEKAIFLQNQKDGKFPYSDYKMIWKSEPIPSSPLVINTKKFSPQIIKQLKRAFIDSPEGLVDVNGSTSDGYTLAKDSDFDQVRQIYNDLKAVPIPPQSP